VETKALDEEGWVEAEEAEEAAREEDLEKGRASERLVERGAEESLLEGQGG
jgi:hypothetical protein